MRNDTLFSMKERPDTVRRPTGRRTDGPPASAGAGEYVRRRAVDTLLDARLTDESAAEAWVLAYQKGWNDALEFCIRAERAMNDKEE